MRNFLLLGMTLLVASLARAQTPADDALLRGQQKAGAAYSELQKAEYETKRMEHDYRQLDEDFKNAQKRADNLKQQADAAKKKFDAAKAKEAGVRKIYDAAVDAVDKIELPAAKQR